MAFPLIPLPPATSRWPSFLGTLGMIAVVAALAILSAYQSRLHYEQQARVSADNLSQVLGNHVSSATEKIDLVLKAAAREILQQLARGSLDPKALQLFMVQHKLLLPDVGDLLVADGKGVVRYGTDAASGSSIDISDRDYFQHLRDYPHAGLVVSGPVRSRVDGRWAMILARRVDRPNGAFAGAVLSVVHADRFAEMLSPLDLGPSGIVALHTREMDLIVRIPEHSDREIIGTKILTAPFKASLEAHPEQGAFSAVSPVDGMERSFVYRRLTGLPFYIVVGRASQDFLAPWWKEVVQLAAIVAVFSLVTLGLYRVARRAVQRQEATSQLLREAVNSVAVGFSIFDRQDRLVICNESARDFFPNIRDLITPGARFEDIVRAAVDREKLAADYECPEQWVRERLHRHRAADGKPFEMRLQDGRQLLVIEHRTGSGHTVINRIDITELARHRDQLEKLVEERTAELSASVAHFRATFEQAGVGVCHANLAGRFLRVNEKFCAIAGYRREELLALDFQSITHPDDVRKNVEGRAQLLAGAALSYSMEKRYVRKDGGLVWVNLTVALVRTAAGEPDYFLAVVEDIQQRKEMERALAEEREARQRILEQQVAERTAQLQAANSQLEGFLYAASHDLKGPLGRISSFSSLLEKNYRGHLEGDGLLFLGFIRENAIRLTKLIDDLLNHARIDQQVSRLQPIPIAAAVQAALYEKTEDIREKGAAVRVDLPPLQVLADSYGLQQVLNNILENALKYSAETAEPVIEICGEETEGRFRLWVRDNGIGFDMAYQDRIFEIFRRLHTYAEYAGSGVGLALVKRAMDRMGGKVWAESSPGEGATFFLEFQLAARDPEAEVQPSLSDAAA